MNEKLFEKVANELRDLAVNHSSGDERLRISIEDNHSGMIKIRMKAPIQPSKSYFQDNDAYKVCYRLISNLTQRWKQLGLEHFPTEEESITIARKVDSYFEWLLGKPDELEGFKSTYAFHKDVFNE